MEVNLGPELEQKLRALATETGRPPEELLHDLLAGYFADRALVSDTLADRYDDLASGHAETVDGDEAFERLRKKSDQRRSGSA